MSFKSLVRSQKMSGYRLSKESGIPQTTVTDLLSHKASLLKCNAETLYKLSKVLGVSMEELLESELRKKSKADSFEDFRKEECRHLKAKGDIPYLIELLESGRIQKLYKARDYPSCYYLVAMADYLSGLHNVPLCKDYHDIRTKSLATPIFPGNPGSLDEKKKSLLIAKALPEFSHFALYEQDVRKI
jgi:transcriptional regulator with XRE-family HTH domain